jgi:hypothetical protein
MGRADGRQLVVDFQMGEEGETQRRRGAGEGTGGIQPQEACRCRGVACVCGAACEREERETSFFQLTWC